MTIISDPYKGLCTEYYDLDKPTAPADALLCYLKYAKEANGPILEPMCGTGRFLIPLLEQGYEVTGFDASSHMLDVCRRRCEERGLNCSLVEATFESMPSEQPYGLIFIPSGSFGLLTDTDRINQALAFVVKCLEVGAKFVFEVETLKAVSEPQRTWKGSWIDRPDGSKLVLSTFSRFDPDLRIETVLCRYEQWKENQIVRTEVEEIRMRLYEMSELDKLLENYGLRVVKKLKPYTPETADAEASVVLYECVRA